MKKKRTIIIIVCVAVHAAGAAFCFRFRGEINRRLFILFNFKGSSSFSMQETDASGYSQMEIWELTKDPRVTSNDSFLLINEDFPLEEGFNPEISEYRNKGVFMNVCIQAPYAELAKTVADRFIGEKLYVMSAYRSDEEQLAEIETNPEKAAAFGASEHQAGLGLDLYVAGFAGDGFLESDVGFWINRHCQDCGFIIRYPAWGRKSTGIPFEPWHVRYVGSPHAEIIMSEKLTLEQYVAGLESGTVYQYGDYIIMKCGGTVRVPVEFVSAVVSADHTGTYIVTYRLK